MVHDIARAVPQDLPDEGGDLLIVSLQTIKVQ